MQDLSAVSYPARSQISTAFPFGPNNFDIHTPKERLSISSTEKVWKLIVEFLKRSK